MRGRFLHRQPPPGSRVDTQHPLGHGCVGWWEMNAGPGSEVVADISGNDNHGTMTNMDAATDWVQGRHGGEGALEFHTQYVNCGQFPAGTFTDSASISYWVYAISPSFNTNQYRSVIEFSLTGSSDDWLSHKGLTYSTALRYTRVGWGAPFSEGTWYHIAVTSTPESNGWRYYVNGTLSKSRAAVADLSALGTWDVWIGRCNTGSSTTHDLVSAVSIYSRALSASDIAWLYAEPYAPIWTPGERKWWWMGVTGAYYYDHISRRIRGLV